MLHDKGTDPQKQADQATDKWPIASNRVMDDRHRGLGRHL